MAYTKKTWENLPSTNAPLNATGMNDLETRIANGFNIIDFLGIPTSEITAEDDLDDFVNEGTYIFEPETTDMPSNVPPMVYLSPFKLLVLNFPDYSGSESKIQIYIGYRGTAIYIRGTEISPSIQWLPWKKILLDSDIGDKYYTSEQVIGTWIDGKPLYRKVVSFTTTSTIYTITSQNLNLDNPDLVFIDSNSFILDGQITNPINNVRIHSNQVYNNNYSWFRANGNQVQYEVDSSFANKTCHLIVNYTKTTD